MRAVLLGLRLNAALLLLASLTGCALTSEQPGSQTVQGAWAYAQTCNWWHSAQLTLEPAPEGGMRGSWSDGTRVRGRDGELQGALRDGRFYMRFCHNDTDAAHAQVCPKFGAESAYVVREGEQLKWYRLYGKDEYWPYLTLHRVGAGGHFPKDDCSGAPGGDEGEPTEVNVGKHRVKIPLNYFRHRTAPRSSSSRLELVLRWPHLMPGPLIEPAVGEWLDGAREIDVTVISTADITPQNLTELRHANLKRVDAANAGDAGPRDKGAPVFGLTPYYLDFERLRLEVAAKGQRPEVAANPRRDYNVDWYFPVLAPEQPATFIRCSPRELDDGVFVAGGRLARSEKHNIDVLLTCTQSFEIPQANLIVNATYSRAFLSRWQDIERKLRGLLMGNR